MPALIPSPYLLAQRLSVIACLCFGASASIGWGQAPAKTTPTGNRRQTAATRSMVASVTKPSPGSLTETMGTLPPLAEGTVDLPFSDFFQLPVGPKGLEPSEKLKKLDGAKVRLVGYFVFEDWSACSCPPEAAVPAGAKPARPRPVQPAWMKHVIPGRAMFAPIPTSVSLGHYGLSDELPPQTAFLNLATHFGEPVFYRPGIFAVTGTLNLGNKEEMDGRVSYVRLQVDKETDIVPVGKTTGAPELPVATATNR